MDKNTLFSTINDITNDKANGKAKYLMRDSDEAISSREVYSYIHNELIRIVHMIFDDEDFMLEQFSSYKTPHDYVLQIIEDIIKEDVEKIIE